MGSMLNENGTYGTGRYNVSVCVCVRVCVLLVAMSC